MTPNLSAFRFEALHPLPSAAVPHSPLRLSALDAAHGYQYVRLIAVYNSSGDDAGVAAVKHSLVALLARRPELASSVHLAPGSTDGSLELRWNDADVNSAGQAAADGLGGVRWAERLQPLDRSAGEIVAACRPIATSTTPTTKGADTFAAGAAGAVACLDVAASRGLAAAADLDAAFDRTYRRGQTHVGGVPALCVQATRLSGGGLALGLNIHHAVADMAGIVLILRDWAAAAANQVALSGAGAGTATAVAAADAETCSPEASSDRSLLLRGIAPPPPGDALSPDSAHPAMLRLPAPLHELFHGAANVPDENRPPPAPVRVYGIPRDRLDAWRAAASGGTTDNDVICAALTRAVMAARGRMPPRSGAAAAGAAGNGADGSAAGAARPVVGPDVSEADVFDSTGALPAATAAAAALTSATAVVAYLANLRGRGPGGAPPVHYVGNASYYVRAEMPLTGGLPAAAAAVHAATAAATTPAEVSRVLQWLEGLQEKNNWMPNVDINGPALFVTSWARHPLYAASPAFAGAPPALVTCLPELPPGVAIVVPQPPKNAGEPSENGQTEAEVVRGGVDVVLGLASAAEHDTVLKALNAEL